jgi:Trk-type K+ transport system membrane component
VNPYFHVAIAVALPSTLIVLSRRYLQNVNRNRKVKNWYSIRVAFWSWILGFLYLQIVLAPNLAELSSLEYVTEDDLGRFDGPNITALWILTGWVGSVLCLFLARLITRKTPMNQIAEQDMMRR